MLPYLNHHQFIRRIPWALRCFDFQSHQTQRLSKEYIAPLNNRGHWTSVMLERKLRGKRNSTGFRKCFFVVDFWRCYWMLEIRKEMKKFPSFEFHLVKISKDFLSMKNYRCKLHLSWFNWKWLILYFCLKWNSFFLAVALKSSKTWRSIIIFGCCYSRKSIQIEDI